MDEFIKKLIERLEELKNVFIKGNSHNVAVGINKAISIVNQLAEEYNNGWIFCIEGKPETMPVPFDNVLICTKEGGRTIGHRCPNQAFGRFYDLHSSAIDDVIAWQPLPAPYSNSEIPNNPQDPLIGESVAMDKDGNTIPYEGGWD